MHLTLPIQMFDIILKYILCEIFMVHHVDTGFRQNNVGG